MMAQYMAKSNSKTLNNPVLADQFYKGKRGGEGEKEKVKKVFTLLV